MKKNAAILCTFLFIAPLYSDAQPQENPLFTAAREGNISEIRQALDNHADCSIQDNNGNTLLHIAAAHGHENIIDELTKYRGFIKHYMYGPTLPDIATKNKNGDSLLDVAIRNEKPSIIAYLHTEKEFKTTEDEQKHALQLCIDKDDPNILNLLHFYNYNILLSDKNNNNLLHHAAKHNKKRSIHYLAQHKELINSKNASFNTPLMSAMLFDKQDEETIKLLVDNGADVNTRNNNQTTPLHLAATITTVNYLLDRQAHIDSQDSHGRTALLLNIEKNNLQLVQHLIKKNADMKKRNNHNESALKIALRSANPELFTIIAQHPDSNINEQNHLNETALMIAAAAKNFTKFKILCDYKANALLIDKKHQTVLHHASQHGFIEGAQLLIEKNPALITMPDNNGNIPLMTAVKYNQKELVKYLLHNCPSEIENVNNNDENILDLAAQLSDSTLLTMFLPHFSYKTITRQNKDGFTLAHHITKSGSIANAPIIQQYNLSYTQRTHKGDTCAHIAAQYDNVAMFALLKANNEDFDVRNYNQETPFMQATFNDSLHVVQFLLSEKHFINSDVKKIIASLKQAGKCYSKVYIYLKEQHDIRLSRSEKIFKEEYQATNKIIEKNQSLRFSIVQKDSSYSSLLSQHKTATPRYKSVDELYNLSEQELTTLLNHYRECKDHELNHQKALQQTLNAIRRQEEAEAARRALEEMERRMQAARNAAEQQKRIEQERAEAARNAAVLAKIEADRRAAELEKELKLKQQKESQQSAQPTSNHDRQVYAQKNIDLFKENFKKEHGKRSNNNFAQKDIYELEKCIKQSTLSHITISAQDSEAHINNGILLFLDEKLKKIKDELQNSNKYATTDLQTAIEKTRKEITTAVNKLKQPTYQALAELLGENNSDKENNIMKRVIANIRTTQ